MALIAEHDLLPLLSGHAVWRSSACRSSSSH
jgi:hypothetical protein